MNRLAIRLATHLAFPSKKPKRSLLTLMDSMIASTTRSASSTAWDLYTAGHQFIIQDSSSCTHESVVVEIFFKTLLVKPSMSSGDFFLATLASDFEIILTPFLQVAGSSVGPING